MTRVGKRGKLLQVAPIPGFPTPKVEDVLLVINAARAQAGLGALRWNGKLAQAAQGHAEYIKSIGHLSHTGAYGSQPGDRLKAAGYHYTSYGETIAEGFSDAHSLVNAWLNSPGHRQIILGPYRDIGIGVARRGNRFYFCADAATGG